MIVIIERGEDGTYDAYLENTGNLNFGLLGQGKTVQETMDDFMNSKDEMKAYFAEEGKLFPEQNFCDQAHFTRAVKKLAGVVPKELAKNKNDRFVQFSSLLKK